MRIEISNQDALHSYLTSQIYEATQDSDDEQEQNFKFGCITISSDVIILPPPLKYSQLVIRARGDKYGLEVFLVASKETPFEDLSRPFGISFQRTISDYGWRPTDKELIGSITHSQGTPVITVADVNYLGQRTNNPFRRFCLGCSGAEPQILRDENEFFESATLLEKAVNSSMGVFYKKYPSPIGTRKPRQLYLDPML